MLKKLLINYFIGILSEPYYPSLFFLSVCVFMFEIEYYYPNTTKKKERKKGKMHKNPGKTVQPGLKKLRIEKKNISFT